MNLRVIVAPVLGLAAVLFGFLVFGDVNGQLVYYLTPTEAIAARADVDQTPRRFRLAGTVVVGSVVEQADTVTFTMTDGTTDVDVAHRSVPPQLFRSGIQVVVEGEWAGSTFTSDTMLIKHDETYYPPDEAVPAPGSTP